MMPMAVWTANDSTSIFARQARSCSSGRKANSAARRRRIEPSPPQLAAALRADVTVSPLQGAPAEVRAPVTGTPGRSQLIAGLEAARMLH
jgi:hypothetical protein